MGIKGLYSCIKHYSHPIQFELIEPRRIGLDAYPFLYKFKYDLDSCLELFQQIQSVGHQCVLYVDGTPPKEKQEELWNRKQQREGASKQAEELKAFLEDSEKSGGLDEEAKKLLEKEILGYEAQSFSISKSFREKFLEKVRVETNIPIHMCEGESDDVLIRDSLEGKLDIVVANDMDLFVGGVERLWILGKTSSDPLFLEFIRSEVTKKVGIQPKAWIDVALLAGYEKTPELKRCSVQQAISYMKSYGSLETFFARRMDILQPNSIKDYVNARKFFTL